ncbi:Eukaryotic translation initiation factor 3 subunit M [Schizosaccharomyces pombe]|uniref:Eukaryotic translation initiation factor 3 subunit M n=1 Tax=Schizosaccharomyces pombe (strain 972 / ATCC 24843) TaxID=284812 RepID=EIF3M_SCHPO|nr:translation initiation factor eIF3m [Schizosaccharomyces pombe]Q09722.2 RecName: Full=Eukaryotic translation initiation factor 3 subunit M; Short=eIF3m [Schizosaccharomyces pombe 972h-]CAB61449.2 translation initiation factor eIF3m [Schizosaccharomyces pombe]|eukprot:NP_592913.2 translation initiation factor eIF3m [Schizosaccharomyces pombe]
MEGSDFILVVDSSVEEQVEELAMYLDNLEANTDKNVLALCREYLASENVKEVLNLFLTRLPLLAQAPEKELEPILAVFINLIQESAAFEDHVSKFCQALEQIADQNNNLTPAILSVLSILFNTAVKERQHARLSILTSVVTLTTRYSLFSTLAPNLKYFPDWLKEAGVSVSDHRAFNIFVSKAIQSYDDEQSFAFLLEAVKMDNSTADEAVRELVQRAVNSPKYFFFDDIVTLPPVQQLEQSTLQLLGILSGGMTDDYVSWVAENHAHCQHQKFDEDAIARKMKLLTIASLATQAPNNTLSYGDVAKSLKIDENEVELWIIDVIRAGLVEGRMSQLTKTLSIHRSSYRVFGKHEWVALHEKLAKWGSSLRYMLQVMEQPLSSFTIASSKKGNRDGSAVTASE